MTSRVAPPQMDDKWKKKARCRQGWDTEVFFCSDEEHGTRTRTPLEEYATSICSQCPVSGNCLDWAMTYGEFGIWGGTTTKERRELRRTRQHGTCLRCKSGRGFLLQLEDAQVCTRCGLTWLI